MCPTSHKVDLTLVCKVFWCPPGVFDAIFPFCRSIWPRNLFAIHDLKLTNVPAFYKVCMHKRSFIQVYTTNEIGKRISQLIASRKDFASATVQQIRMAWGTIIQKYYLAPFSLSMFENYGNATNCNFIWISVHKWTSNIRPQERV